MAGVTQAPRTELIRGILWTCERRGSWVSRAGRIEEVANPRRWAWRPSVILAVAYPGIAATGYSLHSCAVMVALRLERARRWPR